MPPDAPKALVQATEVYRLAGILRSPGRPTSLGRLPSSRVSMAAPAISPLFDLHVTHESSVGGLTHLNMAGLHRHTL